MVTITGRTTITIEPRALLQNALDVLDSSYGIREGRIIQFPGDDRYETDLGDAILPMWESVRLRIAAYDALKAYLADQERSR